MHMLDCGISGYSTTSGDKLKHKPEKSVIFAKNGKLLFTSVFEFYSTVHKWNSHNDTTTAV